MWLPRAKLAHCTMPLNHASEWIPGAWLYPTGAEDTLPVIRLCEAQPGTVDAPAGRPLACHSVPPACLVPPECVPVSAYQGSMALCLLASGMSVTGAFWFPPPLPLAGEFVVSSLTSARYRRYRNVVGGTPTKGILALLKQYNSTHRSVPMQQQGQSPLPDAFRLILVKQTAWLIGLKSMTFWREATASSAAASSVQQRPASSTSSFLPHMVAPATISPNSNPAASTKNPSHWFPGLELHQKLRDRLAALPPASVQQVIAACDAAVTATTSLRANAAAASASAAVGDGGGDDSDNDDGSGWSEVRRPGARRGSSGGGGGSRLDACVLMKGLARTVMKVGRTVSRMHE